MIPTVVANVTIYNPDWKGPGDPLFLYNQPRLVEVVSVHFQTGNMRVRYMDTNPEGKSKVRSEDIDSGAFFAKYSLTEMEN